jgi:hypothetical protein
VQIPGGRTAGEELAGALHGPTKPGAKAESRTAGQERSDSHSTHKFSWQNQYPGAGTLGGAFVFMETRNAGVALRAENRPQREEKSRLGERQICVKTWLNSRTNHISRELEANEKQISREVQIWEARSHLFWQ